MIFTRISRPLVLGSLSLWFGLAACTDNNKASPADAPAEQAPQPAVPGPVEPAVPDAERLLADAVEAMGGAAKFAALKSFYAESKLDMGGLGLTGTAKTWWRGGDFYNETEMPGVGQMRVGSLGGKPWGDDPISGRRPLTGKEAEQAMWSATLCLAHDWKQYFKKAETTAVTTVDGKKLAEITFTSPLDDKVVLRIDMDSKLPVSESFTQASPLGSMPMTVYFKDFREIEGVKIPFEQLADASLSKFVSTTTKLEFNAPVDDTRFEMPGAKDAVTPGAVDGAKVEPAAAQDASKPAEPAAGAKGKTGQASSKKAQQGAPVAP